MADLNRYRVLLPLTVHTEDAAYTQGDEFEHEFTVEDEAANLASGLLELLPRKYKVIGGSEVYETPPGEEFEAALPLGQEALLIEGGHIERVEKPAKKSKKKEAKS
jgi:hypothetical protein